MHKGDGGEGKSALYLLYTDMSQYKLMRGIILSALGLALSAGFFIPFQMTHAAVLYEQSKIGTEYDVLQGATANYGYYVRIPQSPDELTSTTSTFTSYTGTAEWLRIKRLAGLSCDAPFSITITTPDRNTVIGTIPISSGVTHGDYCDFPMTGPNRNDMAIGALFICLSGDCDNLAASFVLDGSPQNSGYVTDGTETVKQPGGWAFQICDSGGCEGGFELATTTATSTATSTDTGTGTTTATSTATSTPPTGASSVLFLPGIMSSWLYKDRFGFAKEQVWTPNDVLNDDIYDLSMSVNGESFEDIYTEKIIDTAPVGDIYRTFIDFMNQLESSSAIKSWAPFAYDWRYSVDDIAKSGTQYENEVKNAIAVIENLASTSYSKKVTIIGHSNGGLLAKSVMQELELQGKVNLVDKVVLLASPQLGTPKSIATILHGYELTDPYGGVVMTSNVARQVINNMPGAYGLLPSEKFFEGLNDPIVTFTAASATLPYRDAYGDTISGYEEMINFLNGEDAADRDMGNVKYIPITTNPGLLSDALNTHKYLLDNWTAPSSTKVIEIVGTGLPTLKAIEYRGVDEEKCASAGPAGVTCITESDLKPFAVLTKYGDGTVVQRSAEAYQESKEKYFVNLDLLNDTIVGNKLFHHNISEAQPVQSLLHEIIVGSSTTQNQFVSSNYTTFTDEYDVEAIDSPVRMLATDTDGNQTGVVIENNQQVIKQDIPGSQYLEMGGTKYIVVPKGTDRTTKLYGEDYGGYTLTTATLGSNDTQIINTVLANASVTPTMVAEYSNKNNKFSTVVTDLNGDGVKDLETTITGVVIPPPVVITYPLLVSYIQSLKLNTVLKQALILVIKSAESYAVKKPRRSSYIRLEDELLQGAKDLTKLYIKKKYLTTEEGNKIISMIEALKAKQ